MLASSTSAAAARETPNVLIILVDDFGYGDAACYNANSKIRTPHIDSLARNGMRFTDAHAPGPLCHLSRYGLMTGRFPFRANPGQWSKKATIDADRMTVGSLSQSVGYRTAMVGKWHLGFDEDGYDKPLPGGPVDRGFGSYFGIRASTDIPPYFYIRGREAVAPPTNQIAANNSEGWSPIQGAFWRAGGIAPGLELKDVLPKFTDEAISVIESHAEQNAEKKSENPLLLYLAYPAPHTPWLPAPEFLGKSGASMYGDFTVMVDAMIGRVLAALDKAGMSDDTLVIFSSDNGPVWYEEDVERFGHDSSGGLRGMKSDAWEAGHRMPFIVRWPGQVKPSTVAQQTICFTDVLATLADVYEVPLRAGDGPDSFSFLSVLRGRQPKEKPIRSSLVMRSGGGAMTVRVGDWKLIDRLGSGGFSQPRRVKPEPGGPTGQLYNLKDDPAETTNLFAAKPEIVKRLQAEMNRVVKSGRSRPQ
jgi:arylsulfatase A-like enzyme